MPAFTLKEIRELIRETPKEIKGLTINKFHTTANIGRYTDRNGNIYVVHVVLFNNKLRKVVADCGFIR